jgi:hypothetical protein
VSTDAKCNTCGEVFTPRRRAYAEWIEKEPPLPTVCDSCEPKPRMMTLRELAGPQTDADRELAAAYLKAREAETELLVMETVKLIDGLYGPEPTKE